MFALPFVFAVFIINFPAGLILYWTTTNFWTIGQQLVVRKLYPQAGSRQDGPSDNGGSKPRARETGRFRRRRRREEARGGKGDGADGAKAPPQSPKRKKKRSGRRR